MRQRIDNIMVVEQSDFLANLEPRAGACGELCDTLFAFDHLAASKFAYRELFDNGADARWDLTQGAFFDAAVSAPATLGAPSTSDSTCPNPGGGEGPFSGPGGSLGFGRADSPPLVPECCPSEPIRQYASTRMLIGGLRPNTPYVLSFWWASDRDENCYGPPFEFDNPLENGDMTVEVYSCDLAMNFEFAPQQLNLAAHGGWVTGYLEPTAGLSIAALDIGSITLNGKVHVASGAPSAVGDYDSDGVPDLMLKFPRAELQATLAEGKEVMINVSGFANGDMCFDGTDRIRVRAAPTMSAPAAGSVFVPGSQVEVRWEPGRGAVDLLATFDGGLTWRVEARDLPNTGFCSWIVPSVSTPSAHLAIGSVHAEDGAGLVFESEMGETGAFTISSPTDTALRASAFSLVGVSPNPTRRSFTVTFALPSPAPASITVYDVKGRLVAVNQVGALGPGLHALTLGDRHPLPAGVYMVRLTQSGRSVTARATVIH